MAYTTKQEINHMRTAIERALNKEMRKEMSRKKSEISSKKVELVAIFKFYGTLSSER